MYLRFSLAFSLLISNAYAEKPPHPAPTFDDAKIEMYQSFSDHQNTLYCGCEFDSNKDVDLAGCGYQARKNWERASRTEAEHIVPASKFGGELACWQQPLCTKSDGTAYKGRKCCSLIDKDFQVMENDLHNLWPAVGEINGDRGNSVFKYLPDHISPYGQCEFKVDFKLNISEPPDRAKGTVARSYLYMHDTYGVDLDNESYDLYLAWNQMYPPSAWEHEWQQKVAKYQGNENQFITQWGSK